MKTDGKHEQAWKRTMVGLYDAPRCANTMHHSAPRHGVGGSNRFWTKFYDRLPQFFSPRAKLNRFIKYIDMIQLDQIHLNDENPRYISDDKFKKLVKSIKEFPQMMELRPIIVDDDNVIQGGNMRYRALLELGYDEVPEEWIKQGKELTPEQWKEFVIKDNVGFGEWDFEMLANEWNTAQLIEWGLDLPAGNEDPMNASDDDYEIPTEIQTDIVLGDLFEIGEHRLLCGDSTDSDAVAMLMGGEKANLCFTSPPYNAGKSEMLSGNTHTTDNKYKDYNDNQKQPDYLNLLIGFTNNALIYSNYLICNIQSLSGNKVALIDYLHQYKNNFIDVAIWDKGNGAPAMAENVMTSVWEYMFFISSKENATRAIPNAGFRGTVPNIYRGNPQRKNEFSSVHAATFPIDLPEWALQFTKEKDVILDLFLGTGTTMVASHQLNRKCYGMELDPKYCQVIIDRMRKLDPEIIIKKNGVNME